MDQITRKLLKAVEVRIPQAQASTKGEGTKAPRGRAKGGKLKPSRPPRKELLDRLERKLVEDKRYERNVSGPGLLEDESMMEVEQEASRETGVTILSQSSPGRDPLVAMRSCHTSVSRYPCPRCALCDQVRDLKRMTHRQAEAAAKRWGDCVLQYQDLSNGPWCFGGHGLY
jgi:hypothetical protein